MINGNSKRYTAKNFVKKLYTLLSDRTLAIVAKYYDKGRSAFGQNNLTKNIWEISIFHLNRCLE